MTDIDDPQFDIEPRLIMRYLQHVGWSAGDFGHKFNRVFFKDDAPDTVEIFFEKLASKEIKRKEVFFALKTISEFYDREISDVSNDIKSLSYDQITSKIPNEYVLNDTIQLRTASQYINQMRGFLASSATTELTGERHSKRTRKEAMEYAEQCRFGHTFRGSFGFLIESFVGLNEMPTLDIISDNLPLGRRIVERITLGLAAYEEAVETQNPSVIAECQDGFSANMCDAMADMIEETDVSKMVIGINLSPEWRSKRITSKSIFFIEYKNIELLRVAAKSMRVDEKPRPVQVFGRVRRVETDGNPADLSEDTAPKEIEINWASDDNTLLHVKVMLPNADYAEAVEAHRSGKPVSASGMLVRVGRSWRLDQVENFKVMTF
ncbi:hypothetical protein AA0242T_2743 [Acetobacter aceti NRIC 0242]|uniref:Uncharacterized protein n=1 Tax=Acetobacter aceti NBRC 14818 TaxID=887700 RepID=A0AB33IHU3_ACEAC|nr:hypothetical protein [Acetobacter aceti]TCS31408.1 hypothetical protein EDC15_11644 [Acetobacter aceti NBRC 14818]BCK76788.1 hypothetical protein EMQ_2394 [Acetobacter aceti NBRC 14818]GAN56891.1 hypothetical protein Abac_011_018 [Acetobacter aceti NBRC 14818]GBO82041.1 hypothetical protein AA0242T_2743 [Acetobacter aceti NRIC 0242]